MWPKTGGTLGTEAAFCQHFWWFNEPRSWESDFKDQCSSFSIYKPLNHLLRCGEKILTPGVTKAAHFPTEEWTSEGDRGALHWARCPWALSWHQKSTVQRLQIKAGEHTAQSPSGFRGDGWWPRFSRLRGPAPPAPVLLPLPMPDMPYSGLGSRVMQGHIKPQTESSARKVCSEVLDGCAPPRQVPKATSLC